MFHVTIHLAGDSDADCEAHGEEELSCEGAGMCRNPRIYFRHLFGQDGDPHSEPDDRLPYVVR